MTATFGRKGLSESGAPASRRAAFLGEARAPADRVAETEVFPTPVRFAFVKESVEDEAPIPAFARQARPVGPRSLKITYALWLLLGIAGAHRLYLGRTISGGLQAAICIGCFAAMALQYYQAFAGLAICWLWMFADGIQLKKMYAEATAPAEAFA